METPAPMVPTVQVPRATFVPPESDEPEAWQAALYCDAVAKAPALEEQARLEWIVTELDKALAALGMDPNASLFSRLAGMTPEARSAHFRGLVERYGLGARCAEALREL